LSQQTIAIEYLWRIGFHSATTTFLHLGKKREGCSNSNSYSYHEFSASVLVLKTWIN